MTTFRLREMRERAGMTQRQLAALVGRWPGDISNWETGKHIPRLDVAADIAIALGCSLDELAGIETHEIQAGEICIPKGELPIGPSAPDLSRRGEPYPQATPAAGDPAANTPAQDGGGGKLP